MTDLMTSTPIVMSITDHDPCGGAGISAAIETVSSLGCLCTPIITRLSARDTAGHKDSQTTGTRLLIEQIRAVLEDIPVNLLSIGIMATVSNVEAIYTILKDYPEIPVVFHHQTEKITGGPDLDKAIRHLILPQTTIAIIKHRDALLLSTGADTLTACARDLIDAGCKNLLITSSDNYTIKNFWFSQHGHHQCYDWPKLPHKYQGAGDTLAAALSAYLAHGLSLAESIQQAQKFTWQTLKEGHRIGMGKLLPNRMHWSRK